MTKPTLDPKAIEATAELMCRARRVLAYGGLDGIVQRPLFHSDDGVFPQFAESASGYEIRDTTGQAFIDWVNGWGPVILGYGHPCVEEAIRAQFHAGPTLSLMHPVEVEVASMLTEMVPCAEMVAFGKNGSDALTAAVRVARAVTRRDVVLQYGMHGFHDWYICQHPQVQGIPATLNSLVHEFPYNDLEALEELFERHVGHVAAVVMEPVREIQPDVGYLEAVRELATKHGALLIFDEVVTAFRLGNGGAQEYFGVVPDLACLGKSLANGMPLSAVVGRREYMQYLPAVGFGMTFRGETLTLAAARAVLRVLLDEPVAEHLATIGNRVRSRFLADCRELDVPCGLTGPPARMTIIFQDCGTRSSDDLRSLFVQESLKRGVFTNGNLLPSYAHDDRAVELTARGLRGALGVLKVAVDAGLGREEALVGGSPDGPRALIARGFLESLQEDDHGLRVSGWVLLEDGAADAVEFRSRSGESCTGDATHRSDICAAFPHVPGAERAGYTVLLPTDSFARHGSYEFDLFVRRGDSVGFRCRVVRRKRMPSAATVEGPYWLGDGVLYV